MSVISGLLPLAKDDGALAKEHLTSKDGDDPGLTIRVLSRTVNIGISQYYMVEIPLAAIEIKVMFYCVFKS